MHVRFVNEWALRSTESPPAAVDLPPFPADTRKLSCQLLRTGYFSSDCTSSWSLLTFTFYMYKVNDILKKHNEPVCCSNLIMLPIMFEQPSDLFHLDHVDYTAKLSRWNFS